MNPNEVWKFRKARGNFINIYFFITHPNRDLEPKGWRRRAYDLANRK